MWTFFTFLFKALHTLTLLHTPPSSLVRHRILWLDGAWEFIFQSSHFTGNETEAEEMRSLGELFCICGRGQMRMLVFAYVITYLLSQANSLLQPEASCIPLSQCHSSWTSSSLSCFLFPRIAWSVDLLHVHVKFYIPRPPINGLFHSLGHWPPNLAAFHEFLSPVVSYHFLSCRIQDHFK